MGARSLRTKSRPRGTHRAMSSNSHIDNPTTLMSMGPVQISCNYFKISVFLFVFHTLVFYLGYTIHMGIVALLVGGTVHVDTCSMLSPMTDWSIGLNYLLYQSEVHYCLCVFWRLSDKTSNLTSSISLYPVMKQLIYKAPCRRPFCSPMYVSIFETMKKASICGRGGPFVGKGATVGIYGVIKGTCCQKPYYPELIIVVNREKYQEITFLWEWASIVSVSGSKPWTFFPILQIVVWRPFHRVSWHIVPTLSQVKLYKWRLQA